MAIKINLFLAILLSVYVNSTLASDYVRFFEDMSNAIVKHSEQCSPETEAQRIESLKRVLEQSTRVEQLLQQTGEISKSLLDQRNQAILTGFGNSVESDCIAYADALLKARDPEASVTRVEVTEMEADPEKTIKGWKYSGKLQGGIVASFGEIDDYVVNLIGEFRIEKKKWSHEGRVEILYSSKKENGSNETSTNIEVITQSKYDLSERLYIVEKNRIYSDNTINVDANVTLGIGYRVLKTDKTTVAVEFAPGVSYVDRKGTSSELTAVARIGLSVDHQFTDKITMEIDSDFIGKHDGSYVISSFPALLYKLTERIAMSAGYQVRYDSKAKTKLTHGPKILLTINF